MGYICSLQNSHRQDDVRLSHDSRLEQRILAWNDGNKGYNAGVKVPLGVTAARRTPIFTSDDGFENRVDNLNGSRVARDLAEVAERNKGLLRQFSSGTDIVPREGQGIRASLGKMKEAVGKVFDKARKIKS